jgi:hypothetical protein
MSKANEGIGKIFNSNMFSTMKGKLLYIDKGKCYFEIIENPEYPKYNHCAGQIEYLPESMVVCMEFEN